MPHRKVRRETSIERMKPKNTKDLKFLERSGLWVL